MRTKYMEWSVLLEQCTNSFITMYTIIEIFGCCVLFWVGFSSTEWFGTAIREFISIFCCTERNSELCSLPRNGSERNSENLHLFWFHGTEFRVVFSSAKWFGTELWEFASIFVPRNGIPSYFLFPGRVRNGIPRFSVPPNNRNSIGNNHLFRLFRLPRNYFFVGNSQPYSQPQTSHLGSYTRALLVSQDRRHLFVTPCFLYTNPTTRSIWRP